MNDVVNQLKPRGEQLTPEESEARLAAIIFSPRPQVRHRRRSALIAAASLVAVGVTAVTVGPQLLAGNDPGQQSVVTGECTPRLRLNGTLYEASTYTEGLPATRIGGAELSACDDNGANPRGTHFPAEPQMVDVWSLEGIDPAQGVGVALSDGFTVYIALSLTSSERQEILDLVEATEKSG